MYIQAVEASKIRVAIDTVKAKEFQDDEVYDTNCLLHDSKCCFIYK